MKRITDPDALLLQGAADPSRLAILRQLAAAEGVCACDLTACCDIAQPTVSHHLKVLRASGWVRTERRGSFIWYHLRPEALERFGAIGAELQPGALLVMRGVASAGEGAAATLATRAAGTPGAARRATRTLPVLQTPS